MSASAKPRRFALAVCLAAAGAARAQAVAADDVAPATPEPVAAAADTGRGWRVPPVITAGSVSYDLRVSREQGGSDSLAHLVTANLTGRSYIYQPWFATVSGRFGLTTSWSRLSADMAPQGSLEALQRTTSERMLTGAARAELFPRSRFPFELHVERNDSRIGGDTASTLDFRSQTIGFSQRYRPASGAYAASAGFDHRQQWGSGFRDTQDALTGDFATGWKNHDLSLGAGWNQSRRQATGERAEFRTLVGRHNYAPGAGLSVNTTVNWSQTQEQVLTAPTDLAVLQWSSVGLWRRDKSPLTLTGSVRGLMLRNGARDGAGLNSLGLTLGAGYELNKNVRLSAGGSAITSSSNGTGANSFSGSGGISWQGDTIEFAGVRYDRNASASANVATSSSGGNAADSVADSRQTQSNFNAQAGHSLSRSFPLGSQSALGINASQSVSTSVNRGGAASDRTGSQSVRNLQHGLGATWNIAADNRSAYARASYSDSRELGGTARFQLWNFQLSGNFELDGNRSLSGDITWQRTEQRSGDPLDGLGLPAAVPRTGSRNAGGEVTFRQQRLFGIPRLRFSSRLKLAQDVLNQPGMLGTVPDRETRLWENRLHWSIGRLESQLTLLISEVDGRRREFLMWRVQRNFGN